MDGSRFASEHILIVAALLAAVPAFVRAQQSQRMVLDSTHSEVWFDAKSTGGDFTGRSHALHGWIDLTGAPDFSAVHGEVEVDAATFRTGLGLRDRHLRDDLGVAQHPRVHFALDSVRRTGMPAAENERSATAFGRLTVRGTQRDVQLASFYVMHGDSLQVRGSAPIRFTQFGMKPPSRLLGMARVRDDLVLHFVSLFVAAR